MLIQTLGLLVSQLCLSCEFDSIIDNLNEIGLYTYLVVLLQNRLTIQSFSVFGHIRKIIIISPKYEYLLYIF